MAVVGFGSRFNDAQMGVTGDIVPDEKLREIFEVEFSLLRWLVEGQPGKPAPPAAPPAAASE